MGIKFLNGWLGCESYTLSNKLNNPASHTDNISHHICIFIIFFLHFLLEN